MGERDIDTDRIDEAVLALMYLTLHDAERSSGAAYAWKTYDWDALSRLHEKDLICDPVNKAKSVVLTPEGVRRCEALFYEMFGKQG